MESRESRHGPDNRLQSARRLERAVLSLSLFSAIWLLSPAQLVALPGWAKIDEKGLAAADLDPRANIYELLHQREIVFNTNGTSVSKVKRAFYILTIKGAKEFVRPFPISEERRVKKFKAWLRGADGIERSFKQEDLSYFRPPVEDNVYRDFKFGYVNYLPLAPGAIIAEEYEVIDSGLTVYHKYLTFKRQDPVRKVLIRVKPPKGWGAYLSSYRGENLEYSADGEWAVWSGSDFPFEPDEPLMPSWDFLAHSIQVSCYDSSSIGKENEGDFASQGQFNDWRAVATWVGSIYDTLASPSERIEQLVDSLTAGATTASERVRAIGDYVKNEVRYVSVALGNGRFVPRDPTATLENRYGDCKDKTTLTRAMLTAAGFKSAATLASINSPVNDFLPTPYQFDHCIVAVETDDTLDLPHHISTPGKDWMIIDPTDNITPVGELSANLRGREVLIADDIDSALQVAPYIDADELPMRYQTVATLSEDGSLSAKTTIVYDRAYSWYERSELKSVTEKEFTTNWKTTMTSLSPRASLDSVSRECDDDSCWTTLVYHIPQYAFKAGNQMFCRADPMSPGYQRQLTQAERTQYIWFGSPHSLASEVRWRFPESVTLVSPPEEMSDSLLPGAVALKLDEDGDTTIVYSRKLTYSGELLIPKEYSEAQAFDSLLAACSGKTLMLKVTDSDRGGE